MDKGLGPEPANLCHNLSETSKRLLWVNKATELEEPIEEGVPPPRNRKGPTIASLLDIGDGGGFVSNSSGFSAYTSCPLLPTLLLIPLI